jgi:indolepyruvate ferredoxin oxidoreductase beta subunit
MSAAVSNIVLAGVGGQGSVRAGQIIARAAVLNGLEVATSEVHGMAQRGGSVFSTVRVGQGVYSPVIPEGEADYLVAFEKLEALRYLTHLRPGGTALVNDQRITPTIEALKHAPYPEDEAVQETLARRTGHLQVIPGLEVALSLGNPRLANTVLLGALSTHLELTQPAWRQALVELVPPATLDLNLRAFDEGRRIAAGGAAEEQR